MIRAPRSWLRRIGILATVILVCSLGILGLRAWVVEGFEVPTTSMLPTFRPGDRVWVDKLAYAWWRAAPARGDVVVFPQPGTGTLYVKRILGLPGERITVLGRQVFIADRPAEIMKVSEQDPEIAAWKSQWPAGARLAWSSMPDTSARYRVLLSPISLASWRLSGTWRIPPDHVFVIGDARDDSSDSRSWGFVPVSDIVGKVRCRIDAGPRSDHAMPERTGCHPDLPLDLP